LFPIFFPQTLASPLQVIMAVIYSKSNINLSDIQILKSPTDHKKWKKGTGQWLIENDFDLDAPANPGPGPAINRPRAERDAYDELSKTYQTHLKAWKRKQLKGVNCISITCGTRGQNLIEKCTEIKDTMDILHTEFKPRGDATHAEIHTKWQNLSLANCKNVEEYVIEFEEIYSDLKAQNHTLDRIDLLSKFIDGLGPAFDSWQESFYLIHSLTDETLSLSKVQGLAHMQEQLMLRSRPTAFQAYTGQAPYRQQQYNTPFCKPCNRAGHWEDKCWILHPHLKETWRKENPEKAAELDTRTAHRKNLRKQHRAKSSTRQYAGMAIGSTTI
jgi:hypothetical protein